MTFEFETKAFVHFKVEADSKDEAFNKILTSPCWKPLHSGMWVM